MIGLIEIFFCCFLTLLCLSLAAFFLIGPILFLYYEESLVSSNMNSNLLRFHGAHPNSYPNCFYSGGEFTKNSTKVPTTESTTIAEATNGRGTISFEFSCFSDRIH